MAVAAAASPLHAVVFQSAGLKQLRSYQTACKSLAILADVVGHKSTTNRSPAPPGVVGHKLAMKRLKDEAGILPSHLVLQLTSYRPDVRL